MKIFTLANLSFDEMEIVLEPEGECFSLERGDVCVVRCVDDVPDADFEVVPEDGGQTLRVRWVPCNKEIWINDERVTIARWPRAA